MWLCNILKFLDTFSSACTIHPIQGTWENHSRVSSLCLEITITWERCTPLCQNPNEKTPSKTRLWQPKTFVYSLRFHFIPFMCCWLWLYLCHSLVWSSSVDAHVAPIKVKSLSARKVVWWFSCTSGLSANHIYWLTFFGHCVRLFVFWRISAHMSVEHKPRGRRTDHAGRIQS